MSTGRRAPVKQTSDGNWRAPHLIFSLYSSLVFPRPLTPRTEQNGNHCARRERSAGAVRLPFNCIIFGTIKNTKLCFVPKWHFFSMDKIGGDSAPLVACCPRLSPFMCQNRIFFLYFRGVLPTITKNALTIICVLVYNSF